jgi:hypothetical protein
LMGTVPEGVSTLLPVELQEHEAATEIQRIARGRQARKYVERRRRRYNRAATKIQSRVRGMQDRRRVMTFRKRVKLATDLQRFTRGKLARYFVRDLRRFNLENRSATTIQACIRGFFGRKRMRAQRGLVAASRLAKEAADALKPKVLEDLAAVSLPPPALATVLQCALILTAPIEDLYTQSGNTYVDPAAARAAKIKEEMALQHINSDSDSDGDTVSEGERALGPRCDCLPVKRCGWFAALSCLVRARTPMTTRETAGIRRRRSAGLVAHNWPWSPEQQRGAPPNFRTFCPRSTASCTSTRCCRRLSKKCRPILPCYPCRGIKSNKPSRSPCLRCA